MTTNNLKRYTFRLPGSVPTAYPNREYGHYVCSESKDASGEYVLASDHDALIAELAAERDAAKAEAGRLKELNDKLWCGSCCNTGWIDSDGNCGNCELGRVKSERKDLKQQVAALRQRAEIAERRAEEFARGIFEKGTIHDKTVGNEWYSSYADGFQEAAAYLVSVGKLECHPTQKGWYRWLPQPTAAGEGEGRRENNDG